MHHVFSYIITHCHIALHLHMSPCTAMHPNTPLYNTITIIGVHRHTSPYTIMRHSIILYHPPSYGIHNTSYITTHHHTSQHTIHQHTPSHTSVYLVIRRYIVIHCHIIYYINMHSPAPTYIIILYNHASTYIIIQHAASSPVMLHQYIVYIMIRIYHHTSTYTIIYQYAYATWWCMMYDGVFCCIVMYDDVG